MSAKTPKGSYRCGQQTHLQLFQSPRENFANQRGFGGKPVQFFAQGFRSKIRSLMERPWYGEAAL
jgi:hypothetical protein